MSWLRSWFGRPSRKSTAPPSRRRSVSLMLEELEARLVPTVSFNYNPHFGPDQVSTSYDRTQVLNNPNVYVIFMGSYWGNPTTQGVADRNSLSTAVQSILAGPYLSGLQQYEAAGATAGARFQYSWVDVANTWTQNPDQINPNDPAGVVRTYLQNTIDSPTTPLLSPDAVGRPAVYVVVTSPNASNYPGGFNYQLSYVDPATKKVEAMNTIWIGTQWADNGQNVSLDRFTRTFSHELAEAISGPVNLQTATTIRKGVVAQPPYNYFALVNDSNSGQNGGRQISDFEPDHGYTYRLNGYEVQAYWSVNDQAFIVPDGNTRTVSLTPAWGQDPKTSQWSFNSNYTLSVLGQSITVNSAGDGLIVNVDGANFQFDPGVIPELVVSTGAGSNAVNVESLPAGVRLTVNLGSGTDTVNFSPSVGQLDDLLGHVDIHGGTGTSTVTVNDRGTADRWGFFSTRHTVTYVIQGGELTRNDSVVQHYPWGYSYPSFSSDITFSGISHLIVYGGKCTNTYDVQTAGLTTPLTVYGGAADLLAFDDSANTDDVSTTYTLDTNRVTRTGLDFAGAAGPVTITRLATVDYYSISTVYVDGGTTSVTEYDVHGIGGGTDVGIIPGPGQNTFYVGDDTNTLDAIAGGLHIYGRGTNTLVLNDRAVQVNPYFGDAVAFTLAGTPYGGSVGRTHTTTYTDAFGPLTFTNTEAITYTGVQTLVIEGGATGNSFDVQSTNEDTDLSIYAGSGDDYITVGDLANNLEGLAGPVHVFGEAGTNYLTVYDRAALPEGVTADASTFTIGNQSVLHTAELSAVTDDREVLTATVAASVDYSDIAALGIYGGAGDDRFAVEALPEAPLTLDGGGGVNTLDYSAYAGDVVVDLPLGTATGFAAVSNIQNVTGSIGNDILVGDANPNALVGGTGRNLIIGGAWADLVQGGSDDNILIPGTTAYDTDPAALQAIMQEWTRTDLGFGDRVNELSSGAFPDPLTLDTVFADLGNDVLVRGPGQDWLAPATPTTISVQSSGAAAEYSEAVTLTATVAGVNPDLGTPTGSVTFFDNGIAIGTAGLDGNGQASLTTTGLGVGDHAITAAYDGEGNFQGGTSDSFTQTVTPAATQTTITTDASPAVLGQPITFTATVSGSAPGLSTPTGTVTFMEGDTVLGSATLDNGVAAFQASGLGLGSHLITAVYASDDGNFGGSTATLTQQVVQASQANVSSSLSTSIFGQAITLTARVSALVAGSDTPTGTVTFLDGGVLLGSRRLSSGSATLATSALAAGSHSITVVYSGDSAFGASTSPALTQKVNGATTKTTVTSSLATAVFGQPITLKATVAVVAPGAGTATGTVTFKDGTKVLGSVALAGGLGSLSVATLAPGAHSITAVFVSATGNFAGSTSSGISQTIQQATTKTSLSGPTTAVTFGQTVTLTAQVTVAAPGAGTPTGTVTFKEGSTVLGTGMLVNGIATFQTRTLSKGSHTITAVYGGDTNMLTSISLGLVVTIR